MKKKLSKLTVFALVLGAMLCFAAGAAAADTLQEIKAYLDSGITVTLDGEAQTFLDANGTRVYPISYNGTTYLPVRAVAGLVGLDVNWDQATKTVQLGKTNGVDLIDTYKAYHFEDSQTAWARQTQTADGQTEDISGVSCSHWLCLGTKSTGTGASAASFNLQGKHDTLTFSYYANKDAVLTVLGDNDSVLGEYNISGGAVAQTITIPLMKTSELKFQASMNQWSHRVWIFDAYLDAE